MRAGVKTMSRIKDESDIDECVDIIASGYEWVCPVCDRLNKEIAWAEEVKCPKCKITFKADVPTHAYD